MVAAVMVAMALTFAACLPPPTTTTSTTLPAVEISAVPSNINCSSPDAGPALENYLNSLPAYSSVTLPHDGCYRIAGTLWIHNKSNLTINGNGTVITQTVPTRFGQVTPIIYLTQDVNLSMSNIQIDGAYNGTNGGEDYEGGYGFLLEANHGVTLNDVSVNNIQGDFMNLQSPNSGTTPGDESVNTNISVTNSNFTWCGYHGLTVEAADGALFYHDTFSDIGVDAMDFEVDDYSTVFVDGQPTFAAQDNIQIIDDTWNYFSNDWFASIQGQVPGVQEQNVTLSGNTIVNSHSPLIEATGTEQSLTTAPYLLSGLTITGNTWDANQPIAGYRSNTIASPYSSAGGDIAYANNLTIADNTFPFFDGTPTYFPDTPYLAVLQMYGVEGLVMRDNDFGGALGILLPGSSGNSGVVECGDKYGVNGTKTDGVCA